MHFPFSYKNPEKSNKVWRHGSLICWFSLITEELTCCPMAPLALRAASSGGTGRGLAPELGSGMPG